METLPSYLKLVVYVPVTHADALRQAIAEAGAGRLGKYSSCSFSVTGQGRFCPEAGATPFEGVVGQLEVVEEERVEVTVPCERLAEVLRAVERTHPYEEIAFDVYPLMGPMRLTPTESGAE